MFACNQAVTVDKHGSDCGSKAYREVIVTKKNVDKLVKRYALIGNKLVLLELSDLKKMVGKTIKIRSPLYCTLPGTKICNKCAGELPYILNIENLGLTASAVGSGLLNLLMKAFHDSSTSLSAIDLDKIYID